ncbi:MAG: proline--tRNA ligase [Patescibacteria group bacterium]
MRQSRLFYRSLKETPKEAKTVSHQLLVRASFIDQIAAGIWTFLPLGLKVYAKIENIIREEMNAIGGQEILMSALQPAELWQKSGRWNKMEPPLFKLKDQHGKDYALGSTHEEVITDLISRFITSYKQLPLYLYQIQNKFRNETRVAGGLLRVREFMMKDLYSFHENAEDLDEYYQRVLSAYKNIFRRCDLEVVVVQALSGTIGGSYCHEFMCLSPSGEDKVLICSKCHTAVNLEATEDKTKCSACGGQLVIHDGIEAAHIFKLGQNYSEKMKATFIDKNGHKQFIQMGCYGIGLGRIMASIVEKNHDQDGLIWPKSVNPYDIHFLNLSKNKGKAEEIYQLLKSAGFEVLYDEREVSSSVKLKDADLIGISLRLLISDKTKGDLELKYRNNRTVKLVSQKDIINELKKNGY